ncbi:MAG: DoxX family membrane protein [Rhodanobacter sp.]|nr:MAG: DoxX family membrane protein [Rhodanobacter sp.]TAM04885.1 MAG: DoxX family membrane protein [Rhodanobacter sp.]TAM40934.1 MAG: DoxX family membrane protein [Rhodanobacter sp.]TAN25666.1 MAG: DoxX family membrane protein [Rhodanobacter sp.]
MNIIHNALALVGRILFAAFFIPSGIAKITGAAGIAAYMATHGVLAWLNIGDRTISNGWKRAPVNPFLAISPLFG